MIQHQLAWMSTLGGAYHLTNKPATALVIARNQEMLGRILGSTALVVRAWVFQAVNLALLGKPRRSSRLFRECKRVSTANRWVDMMPFIEASEIWLEGHLGAIETPHSTPLRLTDSAAASKETESAVVLVGEDNRLTTKNDDNTTYCA
jgi:hypothetical protein